MSTLKARMLVPQYMNEFKCIGSDCEDNCCRAGWTILIDKDTYKKYKNCRDKSFPKLFRENIKRNKDATKKSNYAELKLDSMGVCPFIDSNNLCSVQAKLGTECLSNVCFVYPRMYNQVDGVIEKSAMIACPEVLKIALLNPQKMEFDEIEEKMNMKRSIISNSLNTKDEKYLEHSIKYFWQIRIFSISLLQNRNFKLWERLIILGMFYESLQQCTNENKVDEILNIIDDYNIKIENKMFDSLLDNIPAQNTFQVKILKEAIDKRVLKGINSKKYNQCFAAFLHGLEYVKGAKIEEIGEKYKEGYEKYYKPYMDEHEYILENYLVNYVFMNLLPVDGFDGYSKMILSYSLIKMHLIGMARYYKESFGEEHVVKLIQSFSQEVEHSRTFNKDICNIFKENKLMTMAYMAILIKN